MEGSPEVRGGVKRERAEGEPEGQLIVRGDAGPLIDLRGRDFGEVVSTVNGEIARSGLEVRETPGRGYGLFALRNFQKGETVTQYGGVYYGQCADLERRDEDFGDYVLAVPKRNCVFDPGRLFYARHAGRWINEPPYGQMWRVNLRGDPRGKHYHFVATQTIGAGDEFFINYGPDYVAPWRMPAVLESGNRKAIEEMLIVLRQTVVEMEGRLHRARGEDSVQRARQDLSEAKHDVHRVVQQLALLQCAMCGLESQMQEMFPHKSQEHVLAFCNRGCQESFYQEKQ
jgi:hypothetical protein